MIFFFLFNLMYLSWTTIGLTPYCCYCTQFPVQCWIVATIRWFMLSIIFEYMATLHNLDNVLKTIHRRLHLHQITQLHKSRKLPEQILLLCKINNYCCFLFFFKGAMCRIYGDLFTQIIHFHNSSVELMDDKCFHWSSR